MARQAVPQALLFVGAGLLLAVAFAALFATATGASVPPASVSSASAGALVSQSAPPAGQPPSGHPIAHLVEMAAASPKVAAWVQAHPSSPAVAKVSQALRSHK